MEVKLNNVDNVDYQLKETLVVLQEALKNIKKAKKELRRLEASIKLVLADSENMKTIDEFQEKYCKGINYVPLYSYNLNGTVYNFIKEVRDCRKFL